MTSYYEHGGITIYHGDARDVLPTMSGASVDLVLMDPPYGHNNNSNGDGSNMMRMDGLTVQMGMNTGTLTSWDIANG